MKKRKNFGRQPMFSEVPVHNMLDSIEPDASQHKNYILRNPIHEATQAATSQSEHEVNTKTVTLQDQGVKHNEGGWPKDINPLDEEATTRYRRRYEREDSYVDAILSKFPEFSHYLEQNNAIDLYTKYFTGMPPEDPVEKSSVFIKNVFRDPEGIDRPVSSIGWTCEDNPKLVAAYCNKKFPIIEPHNSIFSCKTWNVENPNDELDTLLPPSACWQIDCSTINPALIVGGLEDGRVCIFDIRAQSEPIAISPIHLAHKGPVSSILFMQSRLSIEFFSGSTDGQCMWWDTRNMSHPKEMLIMSVQVPHGEVPSLSNAEGVSALQFDRAFPTRFLCGTDTGLVINVNRKGKSYSEIMSSVYHVHSGSVKAVHRSPLTSKMFITCGDWSVNIWSDEVLTSPIITGIAHRYAINDVIWAPQKVSSYMSISVDGIFRYWDCLRKYHEPLITFPISNRPLLKMKAQEEGRLVAIGNDKGEICLLSLSDSLVIPGDKDKSLMLQTYERETRRERILENRVKEIRLKIKADEELTLAPPPEVVDEETALVRLEEEYKHKVLAEMSLAGIPVMPTGTRDHSFLKSRVLHRPQIKIRT